jgi:hypothetical protein
MYANTDNNHQMRASSKIVATIDKNRFTSTKHPLME